jgi:hypothetical protein
MAVLGWTTAMRPSRRRFAPPQDDGFLTALKNTRHPAEQASRRTQERFCSGQFAAAANLSS